MKSKKSKKKIRLDKHSSASIVLAFTFICFMLTMFMVSNQVGTSYAVPTNGVPQSLKFSGRTGYPSIFIMRVDNTNQDTDPKVLLNYDFKAKECTSTSDSQCTGTEHHMYCIEGQNPTLGDGYYDKIEKPLDSSYAPGLAYILRNSYPLNSAAMSFCNEKEGLVQGVSGKYPAQCMKYTTQFAIWYYLDSLGQHDRNGRTQLASGVMDKINFAANRANVSVNAYYEVAEQIVKLVNNAKTYNSQQQTATTISIDKNNVVYHVSEDGKYLESNEIAVTSNKKLNNYSVGFSKNNCDAKIVDVSGNEVSTFNNGTSFKIKIPTEKLNTLDTVDLIVAVTGNYKTDTVYAYQRRDDKDAQRPIIAGYTDGSASVSVTLDTKLVRVIKTDKETGKPVIGAVLAIHGANGNEITRFTTTEEPHYLNLAAGNYILKEISSPEGYELNSDEIPFTVTADTTINEVEMKNTPTTNVPDTASTIPAYLYIIGSMILIIGLSVIVFSTKQNKSN